MTVYSTDFSEYEDSAVPSDWTLRYDSDSTDWEKQSGTSTYSNAYLSYTDAVGYNRQVLSWDDAGSVADVDIYANFRGSLGSESCGGQIVARCSGDEDSETGYVCSLVAYKDYAGLTGLSISYWSNGILNGISSTYNKTFLDDTFYTVRFQVSGTSLKAKYWVSGEDEPETWDLSSTNSVISAAGWTGIGAYGEAADFDYVSIATAGDTPEFPTYGGNGTLPTLSMEARMGSIVDAKLPFLRAEISMVENRILADMTLPALQAEIVFCEGSTTEGKLPDLRVESRGGSFIEGVLPELQAEIVCLTGSTIKVESTLPNLSVESRMGSRASSLKLPTLSLESIVSTPNYCTVNATFPGLELVSNIFSPYVAVNASLPPLKAEITVKHGSTISVDSKIPGLLINFSCLSGSKVSVNGNLPDLRAEAVVSSNIIDLLAYLPALTTGFASGDDAGNGGITVVETGRFDGTLLKYSRWA